MAARRSVVAANVARVVFSIFVGEQLARKSGWLRSEDFLDGLCFVFVVHVFESAGSWRGSLLIPIENAIPFCEFAWDFPCFVL